MISEEQQDKVISYLLGELARPEAEAYELLLERDVELHAFVREMRETLARMGDRFPGETPSPALRARILSIPKLENAEVPVPLMDLPVAGTQRRVAGWIVAACLSVFVLAALLCDDWNIRMKAHGLETRLDALQHQDQELQIALASLQQRPPALAGVRLVSLAGQTAPFTTTNATVLWDADHQQGVVSLKGLPRTNPGKAYELWVIGTGSSTPVSAGLLQVGADGSLQVAFAPSRAIGTAQKFAVSIEDAGGSDVPKGPVVLIGG